MDSGLADAYETARSTMAAIVNVTLLMPLSNERVSATRAMDQLAEQKVVRPIGARQAVSTQYGLHAVIERLRDEGRMYALKALVGFSEVNNPDIERTVE